MIDTHTHLNLEEYNKDLREVLLRAKEQNVNKMIVVGIDIPSSYKALELSEKYSNLYPTAGFHPSEVDNVDFTELEKIIKSKKIVAVGECGTDLYWVKDNLDKQLAVFTKQIELSIKYSLPLIIHTRDSFIETYQALLPYKGKIRGVFHCFSGSLADAKKAVELGFYLGIGGVVTFKNANELENIIKEIDLQYLLLETDCPYLAPVPYRGKRNEPSYLQFIIARIAEIKGLTINKINNVLEENTNRLFALD